MSEHVPSGRELEILKVLWDLGCGSVRQVYERMCPRGELAFNTVQTLLRIMDHKGLVSHQERGRTFVYTPRHSREQEAVRWLDRVFDGAMDELVLTLLGTRHVTAKELQQLEAIIADARRRSRPGKKKVT